jgi:hypothetical protein
MCTQIPTISGIHSLTMFSNSENVVVVNNDDSEVF